MSSSSKSRKNSFSEFYLIFLKVARNSFRSDSFWDASLPSASAGVTGLFFIFLKEDGRSTSTELQGRINIQDPKKKSWKTGKTGRREFNAHIHDDISDTL